MTIATSPNSSTNPPTNPASADYTDEQAAALVQALAAQLAPDGRFEVIETHLSRLLLLPEQVYKFKRPVQLPFADFRSLEARTHFSQEELRLNLPLAPDLYQERLAITGSPAAPAFAPQPDAATPVLDWALKMRRFDADQELRQLVLRGDIALPEFQDFAQQLAQFHAQAPQAAPDAPWGTAQQVEQAIGQVLATLASVAPPQWAEQVQALQTWWQAAAPRMQPLWSQRRAQGWIREGHGDLHLGNIVRWQGAITAFDCIEFEPAFRWLDPMADIAFLTMDLKLHGRPDLAWGFLDAYLSHTGDYAGLAVLQVYEVYRAAVRAMAAAFQGTAGKEAENGLPDYASGAVALSQPLPTRLLMTHGLSGSGKSTVALALLQAAGAVRLRSDVERKRLAGLSALASSSAAGLQIYTEAFNERTWQHLHQQATLVLQAGYPLIVDAAFLKQAQRQLVRSAAEALGVPWRILHCHADRALLAQRLDERQALGKDSSEATAAVLALQQAEPLTSEELAHTLDCPTAHLNADNLAQALPALVQPLAQRWLA